MANDDAVRVCANTDCRVAQSEACVEGFDLDACPHYGRTIDHQGIGDAVEEEERVAGGVESIRLRSADALTALQTSEVLGAGEARIVAILGPRNSGKTSLIASVYELFQQAPVAGVEFSRSRTLHAFERASHDTRSASRRREPDMNRTARGGVRFYHLEVGGGDAGDGVALVLGDRSGEEYREVADDASVAATFSEVVRADSLTVLIDGERLLDTGARHNLRSDIVLMLQALHDGDGLRPGTRLTLVLTKLDAVQGSTYAERANRDFDSLCAHLRERFGGALSAIESFRIAASPKNDTLPRGTGVADLLLFWLQPTFWCSPPPRPIRSFERAFAQVMPLDEPAE